MVHKLEENLQYIAQDKKILIYTQEDLELFRDIFTLFKSYNTEDINSLSLDKFGSHIITREYDILIIEIDNNAEDIYEVLATLRQSAVEPYLLLYIKQNCSNAYAPLINLSHGIIAEKFDKQILMTKLFQALGSTYAKKHLENIHNSIIKDYNKENLSEYLDTYEGQVLFLSETLQEHVSKLDSGVLNTDLINDSARSVKEVSEVFGEHYYTKSVTPIFLELSDYLENIRLEEINLAELDGIEYLSRILEDINFYLVEYFVKRVFSDVFLFKDSLKNSIDFMVAKLESKEDNASELEFF
jgi:hypothetical protein